MSSTKRQRDYKESFSKKHRGRSLSPHMMNFPDDVVILKPKNVPWLHRCSQVTSQYEIIDLIEQGSYGTVYRARVKKTGGIVAIKKINNAANKNKTTEMGTPVTALREIASLQELRHPNIVRLLEVAVGTNVEDVSLVLEFVEHDLNRLLKKRKEANSTFLPSEVKMLMKHILEALNAMHSHWIMHRDLKPANLLFSNRGILKVADFGLAKKFVPVTQYSQKAPICSSSCSSRISNTLPFGDSCDTESNKASKNLQLTPTVVTLWYRATEILAGSSVYDCAIDMWAAGCIFAEITARGKVLFAGTDELNQLQVIFDRLGSPNSKSWPWFFELPGARKLYDRTVGPSSGKLRESSGKSGIVSFMTEEHRGCTNISTAGLELMDQMLSLDPAQRISARKALRHRYFEEDPPAKDPAHFPTFPS